MKNINWMLGGDIIKLIFSKLHICNLPNCRIVCKAWNELVLDYAKFHQHDVPNAFILDAFDIANWDISHRKISFMHNLVSNSACSVVAATLRIAADWKDITILNSCNGLLHISITYIPTSPRPKISGIWNPMTNEFFQLPGLGKDISSWDFGFGFNPKTKHYKLFTALHQDSITTILVLSFDGFNNGNTILQWKRAFDQCHPSFEITDRGTYLDGVIYCIANNRTSKNEFVIYGLDVEIETFETLLILDYGPSSCYRHVFTRPFNDTVCVIVPLNWNLKLVWVMTFKHLWTLEFVINLPSPFNFFIVRASEDEAKLYFTSIYDLFCVDKIGKMDQIGKITKIKRLFDSNERDLCGVLHMRSFNFSSLPMILAGND